MPRGLSNTFMAALKTGILAPLLDRVKADRTLCLEIRDDYLNIYYRGGNLMRISPANGGYSAFFDAKYFANPVPSMPQAPILNATHIAAWLAALPVLKQAMDIWQPGEEREVQQLIVRDNNVGGIANSTDYYICDIEFTIAKRKRFDFMAVHWPSKGDVRKRQGGHRLVVGEVKFGDGALKGKSSLHGHIDDVNAYLAVPGNLAAIKEQMLCVFNQKRELGLVECKKNLTDFSDEPPILLLVLANHDPESTLLRDLLGSLPPSPHAELRVATGSLIGYGLYDPAILTIDEARVRLGACI